MPIQVYDYRHDVRNLFVRPEIRGRFLRMEAGEAGPFHSHDVGQEIFLVLEGRCEFEIEGETAILGPGQLCVAWANEKHRVRTVGDEPMTMFLVVTPHLEPTHTSWSGEDSEAVPLPPRYGAWLAGGRGDLPVAGGPVTALGTRMRDSARLLADAASALAAQADALREAIEAANATGDRAATKAAVDDAWSSVRDLAGRVAAFEARWNDLAERVADSEPMR